MMRPAFQIPLSAREFRLIGQLCAIQAQVEWSMQVAAKFLLDVPMDTALKLLGATSMKTNADIWIRLVRDKHTDPSAKAWAEQAYQLIIELVRGRNDFVHSLYGVDLSAVFGDENGKFMMVPHGPRKGRGRGRALNAEPASLRLRSHQPATSLDSLPVLCRKAARLSVMMAYVADTARRHPGDEYAVSYLRKRLGGRFPPSASTAGKKQRSRSDGDQLLKAG